jgi:branched-chain amino acid transport system permease protein
VIEVVIILMFGVDQRTVQALYIGKSIDIGDMRIPCACSSPLASR